MVIKLFGLKIESILQNEFKGLIKKTLSDRDKKLFVAKLNTEIIGRTFCNQTFRSILTGKYSLNIADGRGVLWAAKFMSLSVSENMAIRFFQAVVQMIISGSRIVFNPKSIQYPIVSNIPGVEAFKTMLKAAEETSSGVFFFGATQSDLDGAIKNIRKEFPNLKISGSLNGYDWQKDKKIKPVDVINNTDAKLLIVALGSPLQEEWIHKNIDSLENVKVAVGEGGTLAFISGTFKRAPLLIQKIGLEWLWRLFMNRSLTHQAGSRVKRVWNAVPVFIYEVVKWKLKYGAANEKS